MIYADAFAEPAAEQRDDRDIQDFAGKIPQRDLNSADSAQQHVRGAVRALAQTGVERIDFERVLANEVGTQLQYAFLDADAGAAVAFTDSIQPGVGEDLDECVGPGALQHHHPDVGNLYPASLAGGQRPEGPERRR